MTRIRYTWSSLHVLPYLLIVAVTAIGVVAWWERGGPRLLFPLAYFVVLAVHRMATVEFHLGERWMRVPGPHAWHEAVVPMGGWGGTVPLTEPDHSDGRLVRLADVATWTSSTDGFELRMRDGSARIVPFHGLRRRDMRRVIEYLDSRIGDRRASKGG
jgi:hypothetical protein